MLIHPHTRFTCHLPATDEWYSNDYRRLEFTGAILVCINEWLPTTALVALERAIATARIHRVVELARRVEKAATSLVTRHASDPTARNIETLVATADFTSLHVTLVPIIAKVCGL